MDLEYCYALKWEHTSITYFVLLFGVVQYKNILLRSSFLTNESSNVMLHGGWEVRSYVVIFSLSPFALDSIHIRSSSQTKAFERVSN